MQLPEAYTVHKLKAAPLFYFYQFLQKVTKSDGQDEQKHPLHLQRDVGRVSSLTWLQQGFRFLQFNLTQDCSFILSDCGLSKEHFRGCVAKGNWKNSSTSHKRIDKTMRKIYCRKMEILGKRKKKENFFAKVIIICIFTPNQEELNIFNVSSIL